MRNHKLAVKNCNIKIKINGKLCVCVCMCVCQQAGHYLPGDNGGGEKSKVCVFTLILYIIALLLGIFVVVGYH